MFIALLLVLIYILLMGILVLKQEVEQLRDENLNMKKEFFGYMYTYCEYSKDSQEKIDNTVKKMCQYRNDIRRSYGG